MTIYNGKLVSDQVLTVLTGAVDEHLNLESDGEFLRLVFASDSSVSSDGFSISWTTINLEEVTTQSSEVGIISPNLFSNFFNSELNLKLALQVKTCAGFECQFVCSGEELHKKQGLSKVLYEIVKLSCEEEKTNATSADIGFAINGHFEDDACSGNLHCELSCDGNTNQSDDGVLRKLEKLLDSFNSFFEC